MIFCYKNDFYYDYKEDFNKHLFFCEGTDNDSTPVLNLYTGKTYKCKSHLSIITEIAKHTIMTLLHQFNSSN